MSNIISVAEWLKMAKVDQYSAYRDALGAHPVYDDGDDDCDFSPVTVCDEELIDNHYTEIVSQDGEGEVVLRNEEGTLEFFAIRASYSGWSVQTDDGRVLEFIHYE